MLLRARLPFEAALRDMEELGDENVAHLIHFVRQSRRGFTREPRPFEAVVWGKRESENGHSTGDYFVAQRGDD